MQEKPYCQTTKGRPFTLRYCGWRASLIAQLIKSATAMQVTPVQSLGLNPWVVKMHWRRGRLLTPVFLGFPCGSAGKRICLQCRRLGFYPGLGRSPGEGKGYPLQYSGLKNSMDYTVHGVTKSQTQLDNFHFQATKAWMMHGQWPGKLQLFLFYDWAAMVPQAIHLFFAGFISLI